MTNAANETITFNVFFADAALPQKPVWTFALPAGAATKADQKRVTGWMFGSYGAHHNRRHYIAEAVGVVSPSWKVVH